MYKYGYRLRPPALGTEPKDFIRFKAFDKKQKGYWGHVFYKRKLREGEMYAYDLDYLGEVENE